MQKVQVQSLLRELASHMPHSQKNQNIKQMQHCDEFNIDFKEKKKKYTIGLTGNYQEKMSQEVR